MTSVTLMAYFALAFRYVMVRVLVLKITYSAFIPEYSWGCQPFEINMSFCRFAKVRSKEEWTAAFSLCMNVFSVVLPVAYIRLHDRHRKYVENKIIRPIKSQIQEWMTLNVIEVQA